MGIGLMLGRQTARGFSLKDSEDELFKIGWNWRRRAEKAANVTEAQMSAEVARQFSLFADRIKSNKKTQELGHQYVLSAPTKKRKYVIFSDHHWSTNDNRQNYFGLTGNRKLYVDMLVKYFEEGYTIIENGDVEELVIFEPTLEELDKRAGMTGQELKEHRKKFRKESFAEIIKSDENRDLYAILKKFHADGRYIKIAGNHDYDLQFDDTFEILADFFPGIERPYDYVLLESEQRVEYAILHGHQFDYSTNPVLAQAYGETISESLAWAYQGPDRNWSWDQHGKHWATEEKEFYNKLVGHFTPKMNQFSSGFLAALGLLKSVDGWESLFKHDIAWEYFESPRPKKAYGQEVKKGDQWFKFRHMDEINIMNMMKSHFVDENKRPKLVLGHSHEVRFEPVFEVSGEVPYQKFSHYFNTGAAGRFENLIWGLEIVEGQPKMVSWHRENNIASGAMKRVVYHQGSIVAGTKLKGRPGLQGGF
jgi:hypothetical protein